MLENTVSHLIHNIMPSAADYETAEDALSLAYAADPTPAEWEAAARQAKRRAAELAIAIDGLTDRCAGELACSKNGIRSLVAKLCIWPGTNFDRTDCTERIRGVANAYKHGTLSDPRLPIASEEDVLAVCTLYGMDVYGAGKYGGIPEVIVRDTSGGQWKFLADVPVAIAAWMRFLIGHGAIFPLGSYRVCGVEAHP